MIYLLWLLASGAEQADRRRLATGDVSTLAGSGTYGSADGAGTAASFDLPSDVAASPDGSTVYVVDFYGNKVRAIDVASGEVSTLAGSGLSGSADGAGADASFNNPIGVAASPDGSTVYVADYNNQKVRAINVATGEVSTLAGTGAYCLGYLQTLPLCSADGAGADARFNYPFDVAVSPDGSTVYVADAGNQKVRAINVATRYVSTLAGSGDQGSVDGAGTAASFNWPKGVAASPDGSTVYVADAFNKKVRAIDVTSGEVSTLASSGTLASPGAVGFMEPTDVAVSSDGSTVYVADFSFHKVRAINVASGEVSTLAGSGDQSFADGAGAAASFNLPSGVAVSSDDSTLYVADRNNNKIREVSLAPAPPPPPSPPPYLPPPPSPLAPLPGCVITKKCDVGLHVAATADAGERHAVRCCGNDASASECLGGGSICASGGAQSCHGNIKHTYGRLTPIAITCPRAATLYEAALECAAQGLRLCTESEVEGCCDSGCGYNFEQVWTITACSPSPPFPPYTALQTAVGWTMTVTGSISDFDAAAFKQMLSTRLNVPLSDITLVGTAGSIVVEAEAVPVNQTAEELVASVEALCSSSPGPSPNATADDLLVQSIESCTAPQITTRTVPTADAPTPPPLAPPPPPTAALGDPTTSYGGVATRYWLSMERFTRVFEQGPIILSQLAGPAHPPPGLEAHKGDWVVAMEVDVGGLDVIRIETAKPTALLARPNATAAAATGKLTTLRLSVGGKQLEAGEHKLSALDAVVSASRVTGPGLQPLPIGGGFVERIDIAAAGLLLRITSAKANKFADETLQVLGLHLDLEFLTIDERAVLGALPEMWGLQPMSEATKRLLDKPAANGGSAA